VNESSPGDKDINIKKTEKNKALVKSLYALFPIKEPDSCHIKIFSEWPD
jgi:hypothetical protein